MALTPPHFSHLNKTGPRIDVIAAEDMVKGRFGGLDGLYATALLPAFGVTIDDALTGKPIALQHEGVALVQAEGAVAIGDEIVAGTDGMGAKRSTEEFINGIALSACDDGEYFRCALSKPFRRKVSYHTIVHSVAAPAADGDLLTELTPGYAGKILAVRAVVEAAITTDSKSSSIHVEIEDAAVTGGVVALAGLYSLGAVVSGTAVTALNTFAADESISIVAADTTAFTEGRVRFEIDVERYE